MYTHHGYHMHSPIMGRRFGRRPWGRPWGRPYWGWRPHYYGRGGCGCLGCLPLMVIALLVVVALAVTGALSWLIW